MTPEDIAAAKQLRRLWDEKKHTLGLTQEQAAEKLGLKGQGAVNHYLAGRRPLSLSMTLRFAHLLGVQPGEIRGDFEELRAIKYGQIHPRIFRSAREYVQEVVEARGQPVDPETEAAIVVHVYNRMVQKENLSEEMVGILIDHQLLSINN